MCTVDVRKYFTDAEWASINRIKKMFAVVENLTEATVDGIVRGLIVYGPPGVSKTYNITRVLKEKTFPSFFDDDGPSYKVVAGYMRTPHLFMELWNNRNESDVLVIDDCDSALQDSDSLMLLKAALDTTDKRVITYNALSSFLKDNDIPNSFEFNGSIIFITNTDFNACTANKLKDHLKAITSRCHYIDITVESLEDKFLWIKYVSLNSNMLTKKGLSVDEILSLLSYIETNVSSMNDLSLRAVIKLADIYRINKNDWENTANITMLNAA